MRSSFRGRLYSFVLAGAFTLSPFLWERVSGAEGAASAPDELEDATGVILSTVQNVTPDGVYIDAGRNRGIRAGDQGMIRQDGVEIARVEVLQVTFASSILRILTVFGDVAPLPGDGAEITLTEDGDPGDRGSTLRETDKKDDGFKPLLTAPERQTHITTPKSLTHGRIRFRESVQFDDKTKYDYNRTQVGTSGSVERINGTPWTVRWSGDFELVDGDSGRVDGGDNFDLDWRELLVERPLTDGSILSFGRQIPRSLPAVGFIDGAQIERVLDPTLRVGAMFGFKPRREDLDPSFKEPMLVGYGTFVTPEGSGLSYHGTMGMLFSLYDSDADRLALLVDQRVRYQKATLFQNAEIDVDIGGAEVRSGVSLSRFNTGIAAPVGPQTTLRTSVDHFERPDTAAERDFLPDVDPDIFFDSGFWRYSLGADHKFSRKARVSGEIAKLTGTESDSDLRWRLRGTWIGLPGVPKGQATLSLFRLVGSSSDGVGVRLSGFAPLFDGDVRFRPSLGMRFGETPSTSDKFKFTDLSLGLDGRIGRKWDWSISVSQSLGEGTESTTLFGSVSWRW